eukprot:15337013-Ditylum_brightwellii.AAC.1
MVECHHNTVCSGISDGGSVTKTGNNCSSKQAESTAAFVEEFMQANKGERRKLLAELTIGDMGGQICDELRNTWNFGGGEADEANDPVVSSLQSEGQQSNTNNDKSNKLEPGAGIFLTMKL